MATVSTESGLMTKLMVEEHSLKATTSTERNMG
jgi:hypothetical protein